ncbi:MAG TPA: hypothetical protein VGP22_15980 [Albitalea sp.]|jgi:hypothetical protein|nr:hypothetical protein [Albitalea sp.]
MTQRFEPQDGASAVAPHPHRFTLRGDPGSLGFPPLCAHCGRAAAGTLACTKVFRRTHSDAPTEHVVMSAAVPFCDACIARHRAATPELTAWRKLLSSFATGDMLGAVFPAMAAAFVGWLALKDLARGRLLSSLIMLGLAGFFALIAWSQRRHVWRATEHLRVPAQSDVTASFDFSDNVAPAFEPPRFVCTVRDAGFAQAFAALNRDRAWVAHSPQARADKRAANRQMWLIGTIVAAIALAMLIADWFG